MIENLTFEHLFVSVLGIMKIHTLSYKNYFGLSFILRTHPSKI